MLKSKNRIVQYFENEWCIEYPEDLNNDYEQFYTSLEFLNSDPLEGKRRLEELIEKYPNEHIDAYIHLGYYYYNNLNFTLYRENIEKAFSLANSLLPKDFNTKTAKISWSRISNRAFLRAFHAKGLLYMQDMDFIKAIKIFKFLLNCNLNDNQGIRYLLHDCYFRIEKYKSIISLFKNYPDDCSPESYFGLGLVYYKLNKKEKAKIHFLKGISYYPNIARDLITNKTIYPIKEYTEDLVGITSGGNIQSFEFRERNLLYWTGTNGALEFLCDLIPSA